MLNLVDAPDPKYVSVKVVDEAMRFIDEWMEAHQTEVDNPNALLICCNQGGSRAPTLGLLYLAWRMPDSFTEAEDQYRESCPSYAPGVGMREFARIHWHHYRARHGYVVPATAANTDALAKAEQIWHAFCESMKSDPARAREQLIQSLVTALSAAETQDHANNGTADSSNPG